MKNNSLLDNKWVVTAINALITTIITISLTLIVDKFKPVDPRVEAQLKQFDAQVKQADAQIKQFDAQIKQAETATKKDELMIALTKRLTGKVDDQTVEMVKQDVMDYLARAGQIGRKTADIVKALMIHPVLSMSFHASRTSVKVVHF